MPRLKQGLAHQPAGEWSGNSPTNTFVRSWLGTYLIRLVDPETGKSKYKAARRHQPANGLPAYAVVAEFINQQEELLSRLREVQERDVNAVRIPLSVAA